MNLLMKAMVGEIEKRRCQYRKFMFFAIVKTILLLIIVWAIIAPIIAFIWGYKQPK